MNWMRSIAIGAAAGALAVALGTAPLQAQTFDKLTYLTFTGAVRIPGAVLMPGTYRFHITNPSTSRDVMQVLSGDGAIVRSQFETIPDYRPAPTEESTVTFKETRSDAPKPIDSLFYGGEYRGYKFVYPRSEEAAVAELAGSATTPARAVVPPVAKKATPVAGVVKPVAALMPPRATAAPAPKVPGSQAAEKRELPKTASSLPVAMLLGVASLLAGGGLRAVRRAA